MLKYIIRSMKNPATKQKKYYASLASHAVIRLREVAEQIEKRCTVTMPDIKAVLNALEFVIINNLKNGSSIRLGDLGSFRPTLTSHGSDTAEEVSAKNVKKVRCRFTPSAEMTRQMSLQNVELVRATTEKAADGSGLMG